MSGFIPRDPSVVAIIQARMSSSRLPGKVLMEIGGKPMLYQVVRRVRHARSVGQVVVATTYDPSDDPVAEFCRQHGFSFYRGDLQDVLDRYYQTAKLFSAKTIVRITGDCPLMDPREIDRTVQAFMESGVDFAANRLPPPWERTTPIGMDIEVVRMDALARAWREAQAKYEREHVMPYLYDQEGRFRTLLVDHEPDLGHLRLTVDTPEDLVLVRRIFEHFGDTDDLSLHTLGQFFESHPELRQINANVRHKSFTEFDNQGEKTGGKSSG